MGKRPVQKKYSAILGEEQAEALTYHRVKSALMRASAAKYHETNKEVDAAPKKKDEAEVEFVPQEVVHRHEPAPLIPAEYDMQQYSVEQLKRMSGIRVPGSQSRLTGTERAKRITDVSTPVEQSDDDIMESELFKGLEGIFEDPMSGDQEDVEEVTSDIGMLQPTRLLPADNPYLAPTENYVTIDHVRMLNELCRLLDIPLIQAPEEAAAECARLEMDGIVDAVASDDNNAILFGAKWLIRSIFRKPQLVTLQSLEKIGITRGRLLMMTMMIDGDYNSDTRRRLFTVGPVRSLEIVSHFPDEDLGLLMFKEWWLRVVKGGKEEKDPNKRELSRKMWIKRLIIPVQFPPEDLLEALKHPVVGHEIPKLRRPTVPVEELVKYVCSVTCRPEVKVREICTEFAKRMDVYHIDRRSLARFKVNELTEYPSFLEHIGRLERFDKAAGRDLEKEETKERIGKLLADDDIDIDIDEIEKKMNPEEEDEEDEFEDVTNDSVGSDSLEEN